MLTSKFTVAHILQRAAEVLGPLHRMQPEEGLVMGPLASQLVRVQLSWPKNTKSNGTYILLHQAAEKFVGLKLTTRQPSVGLNVEGLEIKVTDLHLVHVAELEKQARVTPIGRIIWPSPFAKQAEKPIEVQSSSWTGRADGSSGVAAPVGRDADADRVSIEGFASKGRRKLIVEGPDDLVTRELGHTVRAIIKDKVAELDAAKAAKSIQKRALSSLSTWTFSQKHREQLAHFGTKIVGQHYRDKKSQEVMAGKREGNMVLLVREPDNAVDSNAVMVLAWDHGTKSWFHVGYVPADQASLLRSRWTVNPYDVAVGVITSIPHNWDGHRAGPSITIELTGEMRSYPSFRE